MMHGALRRLAVACASTAALGESPGLAAASSVGVNAGRPCGSSTTPSRSPGASRSAIADAAVRNDASAPRKTLVSSIAR